MNRKGAFILTLSIVLSNYAVFAQQLIEKTIISEGNLRTYSVYIPDKYQADLKVPLLFNFHGGSGNIASQIAIADMRPIADTAGFILVYPQAFPDPNDGGSTNWTHKSPSTIDDIIFVEAMIDTLMTEYSIDTDRVYACGYSNGGELAFELACRLSHRIAAIGSVARTIFIETFNNCTPSHPTAVISIHGTKDDYDGITFGGITYYISLEDLNKYWTTYNNTDNTPTILPLPDMDSSDGSTVEHYAWNNGDGCVSVEHFKIIQGGHDWPGSFGNMDINASLEIWNFVSKYNLNGLINCLSTSLPIDPTYKKEILVYPNPVNDYLILDMEMVTNQTYQLYSIQGNVLLSGEISAENKRISIANLPANTYFLQVGYKIIKLIKIE